MNFEIKRVSFYIIQNNLYLHLCFLFATLIKTGFIGIIDDRTIIYKFHTYWRKSVKCLTSGGLRMQKYYKDSQCRHLLTIFSNNWQTLSQNYCSLTIWQFSFLQRIQKEVISNNVQQFNAETRKLKLNGTQTDFKAHLNHVSFLHIVK